MKHVLKATSTAFLAVILSFALPFCASALTTITNPADIAAPRVNNDLLYLGGNETVKPGRTFSLSFGPDNPLTTTSTQANRAYSTLRLYDVDITMDGGSVSNHWFRLHNGRWTNVSGNMWFSYQNIIGCGEIEDARVVREAMFDMCGGTYTFRRLAVGVGNSDEAPGRLVVSGGSVQCDLMNTASKNKWYSGLDIAVRYISNEHSGDGKATWIASEYAAGDVLVSGDGILSVPRISFGGNTVITTTSSAKLQQGAGRLRMTGGEIRMGNTGFMLGQLWDATSWYDVTLSGGKVSALYNGARQDLRVRLSDSNGGVTYDVGSGHTYTVGSPMFGSGGLVKTGAGTMVLNCGNDYTGRTEVAAGRLVVKAASAATGTAYTPAETTCPGATMRLVADDLVAADGANVLQWNAHSGSVPAAEFTFTAADAVLTAAKGVTPTAPKVTTAGFNGHKAVSFDGVSSALAAGGAGAAWVCPGDDGSTNGFTVAMVVRFDGCGEGTSRWAWWLSRPFFGPTRSEYGDSYVWNFALTGAGQLQGGSVWAKDDNDNRDYWLNPVTARPVPRFLDDGRPHVVVMTLPTYRQADGKVTMTVDGYRSESDANWDGSTIRGYGKTYTTLGGSDMFYTNRYTACSIAEICFWRGTQLTEAQIKAFSEEMAETYGAELDGYTTFGVSGQHSKEVHVASGAVYGTDEASFTLPLYEGQTLSGAGSIIGKMSAQAGSTITLSASGSPAFDDLTLADGATIKIADDGAAVMSAASLTIGAGDVVNVDVSEAKPLRGSVNIVTFSSGDVSAENFSLDGAYSIRVGNGVVRLCASGMYIFVR